MTVTAEQMRQRAREALPHFAQGWGEPGTDAADGTIDTEDRASAPLWVQRIEEAARAEVGAAWRDNHFYGLVAETLVDISEQGEHVWDDELTDPEELIDEVANNFSVNTYNEVLYEWAQEAPEWKDVANELRDEYPDDGEMQLEMFEEAMGQDVYHLRYAILKTMYDQLVEEEETTS